jgi:hypothetical protein
MDGLKKLTLFVCLASAAALAACSSQSVQSGLEPKITQCSPTNVTLTYGIGTANVAGTLGLNTLAILRQNAGAGCVAGSSILVNAPTITGPAGFVVPKTMDAGADGGTNKISGSIVTNLQTYLNSPPPSTTFNPAGSNPALVSSYGIIPAVQLNSQVAPNYQPFALPFYSGTQLAYIGGPPAFVPPADGAGVHTSTRDGDFPNGYLGYDLGFVDFAAPPVAGTYSLSVVIPTGQDVNTGVSGYTTISPATQPSLTNLAGLPGWTVAPTFATDGAGGGTITTNFAGGGALTEEYVEAVDVGPAGGGSMACSAVAPSYPVYYTFKVTPGVATVTVPDAIGPALPGKTQGMTFCTGDSVTVYGFAVDYPLYSSAFPQSNGNPAPSIGSGQTDVTTSPASTAGVE